MVDVLGTTLTIVDLSKRVIGYVEGVRDGGKDRESIKFRIEAAEKIIATLRQVASDVPQHSPSFEQLQSLIRPGTDGTLSPISRYEDLLRRIERKLKPKGHDNCTIHRFRKIKFKATWPFEKDEVKDTVKDLESLQNSFQSVLQAVLGGMMSGLRDSVNDSVTMLANKLDQVLGAQGELHDSENVQGIKLDRLQVWLKEFLDWKNTDVLGRKLDQLQVCLTEFLDWKNEDGLRITLDQLRVKQDELLRSKDEGELKDFCSRISTLSPSSEIESLLRSSRGSQPSWIFENPVFEDWLAGTSTQVLWAKGNPGAGKSVLAAVVADHLPEAVEIAGVSSPKIAVASFFYKNQQSVTADSMLKCIARQFLEQGGADLWRVKEVRAAASRNKGTKSFDIETLLRDVLSHFDQAFLIIDALDECDADKQDDTVLVLKSLLDSCPSLFIMVTSREDMDKYFSGRGLLHEANRVDVAARLEDVEAYVQGKMKQIANRGDNALSDLVLEDRDKIVRKIVEHTEGVFLVAVRHVKTIGDCQDKYSLNEAVSSLSSNLGEIYNKDLERIEAQTESRRKLGMRALLWVVNMRTPLRMEQLRQALAAYESEIDLDEHGLSTEEGILNATKGLITVDREFGVLSVHKSLSDYFDSKEKKVAMFRCDPDVEMATICLKYLCFS